MTGWGFPVGRLTRASLQDLTEQSGTGCLPSVLGENYFEPCQLGISQVSIFFWFWLFSTVIRRHILTITLEFAYRPLLLFPWNRRFEVRGLNCEYPQILHTGPTSGLVTLEHCHLSSSRENSYTDSRCYGPPKKRFILNGKAFVNIWI